MAYEKCIGVRVPQLRAFARQFGKTEEAKAFLADLPHTYYDENLLHVILLCNTKKFEDAIAQVEAFLPYIDNWAACDTLRPKVFGKHLEELLPYVKKWIASDAEYTCRFGLEMLMNFYMEDAFKPEYLDLAASATGDAYYIKMMVAWYFATALTYQWEATVPYVEKHVLAPWTHSKTIQKACESYRITEEQKAYLRTLR